MSIKSRVLGLVRQMNAVAGRSDLARREHEPGLDAERGGVSSHAPEPAPTAEHLGVYGALIAAVRDELEHFVATHIRLHLAIAERDRFLLTSIGVACADSKQARELLRQFLREFKPEQVKRYLAREVIGALPNAAAIDLSQFAGLFDADARESDEGADSAGNGADEYRELLAALAPPPAAAPARAFRISVLGRWSEVDAARAPYPAGPSATAAAATTPLAGERCEFDVEDADGRRRVVLPAVIAGRRYLVGKGEGCDIRVTGTYASRRHAEIWLEAGQWWVTDAGSTNGLRVASPTRPPERNGPANPDAGAGAAEPPIRLTDGARIVLSARAEGPASDYPWLGLRSAGSLAVPTTAAGARMTPIATSTACARATAATGSSVAVGTPGTPLTAVLAPRPHAAGPSYSITAVQASGLRTIELDTSPLPLAVGRSRNQALVVDRQYESVSGHHLDIVEIDSNGVHVLVHGDNGVVVAGHAHPSGTRFVWRSGECMVLAASPNDHPTCTLTLRCLHA
jgi:hypothetical protein